MTPATLASNHAVTCSMSTPLGCSAAMGRDASAALVAGSLRSHACHRRHRRDLRGRGARALGPRRRPSSSTCGPSGAGPCKTLGPILEKVIDETDGQVVLAKVDVDANPRLVPGVPGAVDPGGVRRPAGRQGVPGLRRRPARGRGAAVRRVAAAEPRRTTGSPPWSAAGDEASLREALELDPGHAGRGRRPRRAARAQGGRGAGAEALGAARADPRVRRDPAGRRARPHRVPRRRGGRRRRRGRSSTPCSTGSRTTRTPARSSSTCSSCSAPTTPARPVPQEAHVPPVLTPPGSESAPCRPSNVTAPLAGSPSSRPPRRSDPRTPSCPSSTMVPPST